MNRLHQRKVSRAIGMALLIVGGLVLVSLRVWAQTADPLLGKYVGSVTLGDHRETSLIPPDYWQSIDLEVTLRRSGLQYTGTVSLQRSVFKNPDNESEGLIELKSNWQTLTIQPDGPNRFRIIAVAEPIRFKLTRDREVERRITLNGFLTVQPSPTGTEGGDHVQMQGDNYGDYTEQVSGLVFTPVELKGRFQLTKLQDPPPSSP